MDWENRAVSVLLCLSILLATIHNGNAERKIVCYYTNWSIYRQGTAKFSPQNINPYLCTHLIYAFGGFTKDNALKPFDKYQDIEKGGYAKFTGLKTYNKNLKTMLAIGGWNEGSSRFSPMVADPGRRREFVKNAIKFLRKNHFDGLDLDWEYPAFRDGGKPRDKDNYANLVQELREEFERESSKTGRPRLLLTLAMPAGIEYIDKGYDVPRLNEYLDFINLLSYDYHSAYEPAVNHHSPLYPLEEDNEYNYDSELTIDYTVTHLLKMGATSEKIILGIPTYGRSYTLFNQDATDLGSPADGPGIEGDATREKGYLAYYEICDSVTQSDDWEVIQPNPKAMGPYAFKEDQWVGYDDENIVKLKAKYAKDKDLGGIMFWSIDNDDFRGKCHDRPYPLIEAAKETLLTTETTNTVQKTRPVDARKKPRIHGLQSNAIGRKSASNGRRSTTTAAPVFKQRASSSRPKYRILSRPKVNDEEEEEEEEEQEVDRRSYDQSSDEEDNDGGNAVRTAEKRERSSGKNKSRPKNRSSSNRNRRKQTRRKVEGKNESREEQLSNKLTTPEPPTTPDPGTDFKCEDEGFFPHPRDCKKYFWCLESGPGGLGVVAHQFTCPSGLVFNKAADSCDYPRNVVCPKSKGAESTGSTTKAPIVAATSRTTYLYSTTRKPSTEKPDSEEEYEYYDEEEEEEEEKEIEEEEKPKTTTTPKPLLYKTITRNRPTTSTTTEAPSTTSKGKKSEAEKVLDLEDEEDPKVIKELIKLIKKAGGIEELEKQLLLQDKNSADARDPGGESATPATISRTLYERVLNRQANKSTNRQGSSTNTNFANGPGRAQFEGLDEVPEVKSLRRSQKPQYVTIERPRASTKQPPVEEEEASEEEDLDEDNADVASSEEQTVSNPFLTSSTQRATPNYFNIRRTRPSASRNENDVEEKTKDADEETPVRRRRPSVSSKNTETSSSEDKEQESTSEENSQTTKSRYVSVQRFRSTTPQPAEVVSEAASSSQPPVTESTVSTVSTEAPKIEQKETPTTPSIIVLPSVGVSSTPNDILIDSETEKPISSSTEAISTTESVRLVEDSATEILLTTAPASLSTLPAPNTRISTASVSQPRPFGFNRRNRPSSEPTTTPLPASNDQTRSKVASSEVNRLPTLKELIGYRTNNYDNPSPVFLSLFPLKPKDEEILSRENAISNDTQPWTRKQEKTYDALSKHLDLSADAVNAYYVEDNAADEEDDSSLTNKKRIDRQDSSTTTLKPTTMRGIPLINLLQSKPPRGFYVTRSETTVSAVQQVESEGVTTETTIVLPTEDDQNGSSTVASETEPSQTERNNTEESTETSTEFGVALNSSLHANSGEIEARVEGTTSMDEEQTQSLTTGETITDTSTSEENVTASPSTVSPINSTPAIFASPFPIESETSTIPESVDSAAKEIAVNDNATLSVSNADSTLISTVTEAELRSEDETSTAYYPAADRNVTDKESKSGESSSRATISSTLAAGLTEPAVTERNNKGRKNKVTRGRPKVEFDSGYGYEFGRKSEGRRRVGLRVTPKIAEGEDAKTETDKTQQTRRRVAVYRGRRRKPAATTTPLNSIVYQTTRANNREVAEESAQESEQRTTTVSLGKTATEREMNESEGSAEEKKVARKSNEARNEADSKEEDRLRIEENVDRFETEVNTSKSTVTSRNPGNLPSTRLRKPTTLASTAPQNKTANTLANHRKTHPGDGNFTLVNEKPDAADEITETRKAEKDIDQSSRAQEIAVTLAEAPSSRTSATGRPPLRNALRRKISTTIAPRTDPTTSRTTVRFTPPVRSRQRPKAKDKAVQNATTRPRRPPVVDYDYYEDEEEPVVGKSSFNGKLFLTSKGNIRCLDQGNFPHPYSCKKFITCAKMVNGLVIGAEYTCPDKLSYDPVGGICNWSAGLGCKE